MDFDRLEHVVMEKQKIRIYLCGKCGGRHAPPTGRKCMMVASDVGTIQKHVSVQSPVSDSLNERRFIERSASSRSPPVTKNTCMDESILTNRSRSVTDNRDELKTPTDLMLDMEKNSDRCAQSSPMVVAQAEAISKADLANFMTQMKDMIAGTNERMGMLEEKLNERNANDMPQKHVEEVGETAMRKMMNEATKSVSQDSRDMGNAGLISDIRALMTERQSSSSVNDVQLGAQVSGNNCEMELSAILQDVKSILNDGVNHKSVYNGLNGAERSMETDVNGERPVTGTQQRDSRVALASDRSSLNALVSVQRRSSEQMMSAGANGSQQREAVQVDNQCNNNAGQTQRGADDMLNIDSLKNDADLVKLAARRLAELGVQELHDVGVRQDISGSTGKGKKSGAVSKATDKVVKEIDWPHYHITRGVDLLPSSYEELSLDEFCLGYIRMLRDADSKFNLPVMLEILEDLLEDAVDFSWKNVKGYFRSLGLDVEKGKMKWEDTAAIQKRRFTKCRVFKPNTTSSSETKFVKTMPQGGSCCRLFQTAECDRDRDHYPYVHACLYCWQHKKALYKHNESQCFSKAKGSPKN